MAGARAGGDAGDRRHRAPARAALTDPSGATLGAPGPALILAAGLAHAVSRRVPATVLLLASGCMAAPFDATVGGAGVLDVLTNREREVLGFVARGLSNDEIAGRMVISPTTAKTHVSRAMTQLHARDRAQLVVIAYESGLVAARG